MRRLEKMVVVEEGVGPLVGEVLQNPPSDLKRRRDLEAIVSLEGGDGVAIPTGQVCQYSFSNTISVIGRGRSGCLLLLLLLLL